MARHVFFAVPVRYFTLTVALSLLALRPAVLIAQAPGGAIGGQVLDGSGASVPGATVVARHHASGREHSAQTDAAGAFSLPALQAGIYDVTATLTGFEPLQRPGIDLAAGQTLNLKLVLELSGLADTVTVIGTAANYANSIAGKRAAYGIVDQFSTDEIGRLPDKNIGETLNRIPGVSMLLEKGEGRFVQIRGISPRLNNVTINGLAIGNAETESGGRLLPLDVIGGELLNSVQVLKTPTPDMDGQGIGGTLNLTTKQPFDFAHGVTALLATRFGIETIDGVPPDDTKETPHASDLTLAGQALRRRLGWLAGASFSNRKTPLLGVFNDDWRPVTAAGVTVAYPTNVKNNVTVTARERLNLNGALELRPAASTQFYVRGFFANWDELQLRNRFDQGLGDALLAPTGYGGTIAGNRVQVNLRSEPTIKELFNVVAGGAHVMGAWNADYAVQRNDNRVDEPNDNWEFRSGASTFGPDTFEVLENGVVKITSTGRDRTDPSFQTFRRVRYFEQLSTERSHIGTANLRRDLTFGSRWPGFLKAGAKFTRTVRDTEVSQPSYNIGSLAWTAAQAPGLTRGGFANPVPILTSPNLWLDLDGLNAFFDANRADPRFFVLDGPTTYMSEYQSDFNLREQIAAGYAMAKVGAGPLTITGGVRVEATEVDSSAFTLVSRGGQLEAVPAAGDGSYVNVLPSIVAAANVRPDLVARAAFTTAVGRPEFDAIAPRSQLNVEDNPVIGRIGTLSIGNPDLKARTARNFDASLEWYFKPGALASAAAFRKNLANEIIPAPTERLFNHTYQGQQYERFDINTTINAETAFVQGVEFTLADQLGFLPAPLDGLGFAASLTLIDSGIEVARGDEVLELPLLQQANQSRSLTLYYQKGRWDFSTTYKYNANFLTDYGTTRALDLDQGSFARWDARAQFNVTPRFKVILSGINLNDEPTTEFQGGSARQVTEYEYTGRTIFLGLSAQVGR
jgi:TonB-dependent receptor